MTPAELTDALRRVLADLGGGAAQRRVDPRWRRPRAEVGGDWSTGVALELAREAGRPAPVLAGEFARALTALEGVADARVTGPGFLTVTLATPHGVVEQIVADGPRWLHTAACAGRRIRVEGGAPLVADVREFRAAVLAESLHRLLAAAGATVTRDEAGANGPDLRLVTDRVDGSTLEGDAVASPRRPAPIEVPVAEVRVGPVRFIRESTNPPATGGSPASAGIGTPVRGVDAAGAPGEDGSAALAEAAMLVGADALRVGLLRVPAREGATVPLVGWSGRTEANPAFRLVHAHACAVREARVARETALRPAGPTLPHPGGPVEFGTGVEERPGRDVAPGRVEKRVGSCGAAASDADRDGPLLALLIDAPRVAGQAALMLAPELLLRHLDAVATEFAAVHPMSPGRRGTDARARLAEATAVVLRAGLDLLDVEVPTPL
ncbi:DALR anticodon-binding domain-containing protein [Mobilicoccus pelagius]|uniref:Arginyl-tRNA synthetase n=1 Tax=Mobilicoccus pelagius NBRC 104925 TaxID=1089455 RepID=H5UMT8_9MICO|nr:DALR anticodon-binding domain-containing protein [Mobilicoccus pelagius]GAB47046.1 arginyl-tRNA synthetase [Mobilicoccus pelagius NBRC 104925]